MDTEVRSWDVESCPQEELQPGVRDSSGSGKMGMQSSVLAEVGRSSQREGRASEIPQQLMLIFHGPLWGKAKYLWKLKQSITAPGENSSVQLEFPHVFASNQNCL